MDIVKILLVEDDPSINEIISYNFKMENYVLKACSDAEEALEIIDEINPHIIILDWMLPNMSGISLARTLKKKSNLKNIPIIMLTARTEENDRIKGFNAGVDDYITKPFSTKELQARIKAVLKRTNPSLYNEKLVYKDIKMNLLTHKVMRNNIYIKLSPKEFRLLQHFIEHPKQVFSREQLLDQVWGRDVFIEIRTVDVHIRRLRKAINIQGLDSKIRTVRSTGYSLD